MALRMDEQSPRPDSTNPARSHFHIVLALIFIPCGAVVAGWTLAIADVLKGYSSPAQLKWMRLLVALVVVDALVLASSIWMVAHLDEIQPKVTPGSRPVVGVFFESEGRLRVREVIPNLPAARAGLEVGDEIRKVDAVPVATQKEFVDALGAAKAGMPRSLAVRRGEEDVDLTVTPEVPPRPGDRGLFEPLPAPETRGLAAGLLAFAPAAFIIAVFALRTRLKLRATIPVWWGFVLASVGAFGSAAGAFYLGKLLLGGWSLGLILIAMFVQMAVMLLMTVIARKWLSRDVGPSPAFLTPLRAGMQGLFYLICGFPRVVMLLWMADHLLFGGRGAGDQALERLASSHLGVTGTLLFVLDVVLIGPFAEEVLFRGYLVPRLASQWGETTALFASSLIFALYHPHYGPFMPIVFLYGWVFGWARLRSGNIAASVGLHMAVNGFVTAMLFLARG